MPEDPIVHLRLDVSQRGGTVYGQLGVEGAAARAFTGWIGLNAAIDEALETKTSTTSQGASTPNSSSAPIVIGPITVTFSVDAEQSNGSVTVCRCDVRDGAGMPLPHSNDGFEETLCGMEGITTLVVDGERITLGVGQTYCIPRGAVHAFTSEDGDAAFLAIATPGVFGPAYFLELKAVVDVARDNRPDPKAVMAVMRRHGLTPALPVGDQTDIEIRTERS